MLRRFLIIALLFLNFAPTFAEEAQIKETYKLQGQVEYDDNPVETIYLD